ncbi:MAG: hypothetical protein K9L21_01280 [Spirochaetia bacterium]|nr:hypothetical protein [Spirochaetia bacterium]
MVKAEENRGDVVPRKRRLFRKPSLYGHWKEITDENIDSGESGLPKRRPLDEIRKLYALDEGDRSTDKRTDELSSNSENLSRVTPEHPLTFDNDNSLDGLEAVIKKIKSKALDQLKPDKENVKNTPEENSSDYDK